MLNFILDYSFGAVVYIAITIVVVCAATEILARHNTTENLVVDENPIYSASYMGVVAIFLLVLAFTCLWAWAIFFPLDFGHRDEIALLTERIVPQIFSGRFFPLAHLEFNILNLSVFGGRLEILYILPFLQIFICVFLILKIIGPCQNFIQIFALSLCFWLSMMVPFVNLIVPERNVIIFILAALYLFKRNHLKPGFLCRSLALTFATISLYYKEPMFALLVAFASTMLLYKFIQRKRIRETSVKEFQESKLFWEFEIGFIISSLLFLLGYYLFVFHKGGPTSYYGDVSSNLNSINYLKRFSPYLFDTPFLTILIINAIGAHFFIRKDSFMRSFSVALAMGGAAYLAVLVVLGLPLNGYYYSIPILMMVLSSTIVIKQLLTQSNYLEQNVPIKITRYFLASGVVIMLGVVTYKQSYQIVSDLSWKKKYHTEYAFLRTTLKSVNQLKSIYYAPSKGNYNDYDTAILMIFLNKADISHEFDIYSPTGCAEHNRVYNGGLIRCIAREFSYNDDYDVLVIENNAIQDFDSSHYRSRISADVNTLKQHNLRGITILTTD